MLILNYLYLLWWHKNGNTFKKFNHDSKIFPERYKVINYEKLVSDPEKRLKELCDFIGINFDNSVFNFHQKKDDILNTYPEGYVKTYHSSLLEKVNTSKIGVWKKELSNKQVKLLDFTLGKYSELAGYERKFKNHGPVTALVALPGRTHAALLYVATIIVNKFPYKLRYTILNKGPIALARFYLSIFNPKKLEKLQRPKMKQD